MAPPTTMQLSGHETVCTVRPVTGAARKGEASSLTSFKVLVSVIDEQTRTEVICKADGMRFDGSDTTIKLRGDTSYKFLITVTPAVSLSTLEGGVKHRQTECEDAKGCCCLPASTSAVQYDDLSKTEWSELDPVHLNEHSVASSTKGGPPAKAVYDCAWRCDMPLTADGMRMELALELDVQDYGKLSLPIMAKVYHPDDNGAKHGVPLKNVAYTCGKNMQNELVVKSRQYFKP